MARIKISDLPKDKKLTQEETRQITGGATLAEYVSLIPLIRVVGIGSLTSLGDRAKSKLAAMQKAVEEEGGTEGREDQSLRL